MLDQSSIPQLAVAPFSFPSVYSTQSADSAFIAPQQMNVGGILPGNTTIQLGTNNIMIDGANRRIIINDGVTDRIIIGYLPGGF